MNEDSAGRSLPHRLQHYFPGHETATVAWMGWSSAKNGKLLDMAEGNFEVLLTADQSLSLQQNLAERTIAIVVLAAPDNQLETLILRMPKVLARLEMIQPGEAVRITGSPAEP